METALPTSCAHPTVRGISTYTVLGFIGYGVASILASIVMWAWQLPILDRAIALVVPPVAFIAVVTTTRRIVGYERIVFYQTAVAGVASVAIVGGLAGAHTARLVDIATLGVGCFLVFGRIGCFSVACCHGRPARFGIVYGPAHARLGFWTRWVGRRLWPVQLVESALSAALVAAGIAVGWDTPGLPAAIYIAGYGVARFALELVRGDSARPHFRGISEAQWTSLATLGALAIWQPTWWTIACAAACAVALLVLAATYERRALLELAHLVELDRACKALLASAPDDRRETSQHVMVSCHPLPDGRRDWVLSSTHPRWSMPMARRLAANLWTSAELVEGRLPGVAHVIESR